jgi:hypothetical protein
MKLPALSLIVLTSVAFLISEGLTIAPAEQPAPAFELFDAASGPTQSLTWDPKQPLLSVSKIKNIRLDSESGDYQLTFTDPDAKKLAQITQERTGRLLIVVSDGEAVVIFRLRAPIVDGVMRIYHAAAAQPSFDAFVEKLKKRQQ